MEQVVFNPNSLVKNQNSVNVSNEGLTELDSMLQTVDFNSFSQILTKLINSDLNLSVNTEETLFSQFADILQTSDDVSKDLISWFNELSSNEQLIAYRMLTSLSLTVADNSQFNNQEIFERSNQISNQDILKIKDIVNSNNSSFHGNQKELKNMLPLLEGHTDDIKILLEFVQKELSNKNNVQNLMVDGIKNYKEESIIIENRTINLQSSFSINNLHAVKGVSTSENIDQDFEVKTIDLGQLQLNFNSVSTNNKVERISNASQNLQNLFVDENLVNEFGKIIIKNLKLPNGNSETRIQLQPSELGKVNVNLSAINGQMSAQFITETVMGKELLESQIHQLKHSLTLLGYQVDKIEVQQATNSSSTNNHNNRGGFEFTEQQLFQQQQKEQSSIYSNNYFDEDEEIVNYIYNISGIDYTA